MEWRALLRRCPSRSFTVVGDLDQGRGARRPGSWEKALGPAARALEKEYVLTVSYRTPRALTELAQAVVARAGSPVMYPMRAVRDVPDCYSVERVDAAGASEGPLPPRERDPLWGVSQGAVRRAASRLDASDGPGAGRIAVIVGARRARAWGADADGDSALQDRVGVLSAGAAKGLEFDSVVLVEPCEILADGVGDLFVALTRATHDVRVVHSRPLPAGMEEWA